MKPVPEVTVKYTLTPHAGAMVVGIQARSKRSVDPYDGARCDEFASDVRMSATTKACRVATGQSSTFVN